ncbi:PREDICTED: beta-defensin 106-like [Myotis davidii]|uniref:beta-defensin 106-like n=1 Tax=Myotis davidii TaxID=225400 RepID=UPI000767924C|nr:PREDICTED: beta-defensin 106-like [Myotis davidii]
MKTILFLLAVFLLLAPARNAFFDEKCLKLKGRCVKSCKKNEELVALCQRALKCCLALQPCSDSDKQDSIKKKIPRTTESSPHKTCSNVLPLILGAIAHTD